ncbi:MAG: NADH-quinone oxidoreductase subunit N [Candidatus Hodarchaeales archaeon]
MSDIITVLFPFGILIGTIVLCLLLEAFNTGKWLYGPVTIIGAFASLVILILSASQDDIIHVFGDPNNLLDVTKTPGLLIFDNFYRFFSMIFLIVLILVTVSSIDFIRPERNQGIYYSLLIFATIGMMLVSAANDLLMIFVAWELGSLPVYSLAAYQKAKAETSESALKFFLIGAMSSAFILFGISLVYGITASTITDPTISATNLQSVVTAFSDITSYTPIHLLALTFLFVGFGYKMAAVPFHAWAVDVYQGTPTTITTFLAAGSKAMGFAAVMRLIVLALGDISSIWGILFALLAVFTMTLGNVVALVQDNIKRMLAYSSIAHAGYMLIGLASIANSSGLWLNSAFKFTIPEFAVAATEMHILTHAIMKIIAFTAVIVIANSIKSEKISDYIGLRNKHPWISFALTISLLSLMGAPPLAGFISKLFVFFAAIYAGLGWLAFIGIINSAISIFYYMRVIKLMLIDKPPEDQDETRVVPVGRMTPYKVPISYKITLTIAVALVIIIGILPSFFIDFALSAASSFF